MQYDLYDLKLGKLKSSAIGRNILQIQPSANTSYSISAAWGSPVYVNLATKFFQQGDKLKHENGKVTVLEDMLVRVSGNIMMNGSTAIVFGRITRNGNTVAEGYINPAATNKWESIGLTPKIVEAKKNDVFAIGIGTGTANQSIQASGGNTTYLLIEEV